MADLFKYPRTPHLPWSPGRSQDDRVLSDTSHFNGRNVAATEKLDGENTTMYPDAIHARSRDSRSHPSQDWVRALHGRIKHEIPDGWRIVGENLYAKHALLYDRLPSYFVIHSIWDDTNTSLSYDDTKQYAEMLGLPIALELYRGPWDEKTIRNLRPQSQWGNETEGYVVRSVDPFHCKDFPTNVAKYVRANHVQLDADHWATHPVIPNKLANMEGTH